MVTGTGEIERFSRKTDGERFNGVVVGLGALGVVTSLTLDVLPAFDVRQWVYTGLPLAALPEAAPELMGLAYSVSIFTDWAHPERTMLWIKDRVGDDRFADPPPTLSGARLAEIEMHPIVGLPTEACTPQLGVPGPWHERLPHFRMDFQPSAGAELQSEYFVPFDRAVEALAALLALGERITPLLWVSEIRAVAADSHWLSMAYRRDSLAIHFTWKPDGDAVRALLPEVEATLAPFEARPHWGKLFGMEPETVREKVAKLPDFVSLVHELDPAVKFSNEFLRLYVL